MAIVTTEHVSQSDDWDARSTVEGSPLTRNELHRIDNYRRASFYLCLGSSASGWRSRTKSRGGRRSRRSTC
jgi:hypothetical protein